MQQSGYIKTGKKSLYATLYTPQDKKLQAALVLCEPFGEEKRCAYRMMVRLGKKAAEQGIACLRFDVSGTGDSSGSHQEAVWSDWTKELQAAVDFARQSTGAHAIIASGFRAGALLASTAANCDKLILVEPLLSGEELLNDLERRQRIKNLNAPPPEAGISDFGGFGICQEMRRQLMTQTLEGNLTQLSGKTGVDLIRVSGGKTFPPAWTSLLKLAEHSQIIADKPFWGQVDYFESDAVIDAILARIAQFLTTCTEQDRNMKTDG